MARPMLSVLRRRVGESGILRRKAGTPSVAIVPHVEDLTGQLERRSVEVTEQPLYIGRDPSVCELCFPNHLVAVSRIHASVRWDSTTQQILLRDEGSMNGTFLKGTWKPLVEGEDTPVDVGQGFFVAQAGLAFRIVK